MGLAKWAVRAQGEAGTEGSLQRLGMKGRLRVPLGREYSLLKGLTWWRGSCLVTLRK